MRRKCANHGGRRNDHRQAACNMQTSMRKQGDSTLMARLVCVVVEVLVQLRHRCEGLQKQENHQTEERNRFFDGRRSR